MAIDPRIALAGQAPPDIGNVFSNALLSVQRGQDIAQQRAQAPIRNRLLEAQTAGLEQNVVRQAEDDRLRSNIIGAADLIEDIKSGSVDRVRSKLLARKARLQQQNTPTNDTDEALALLDQPNGLQQLGAISNQAIQLGQQMGILDRPTAAGRGFTLGEGQQRFDAAGNLLATGAQKTVTGRDSLSQVQSSQILPNGSTVQVFKDGSTRVTGPQGNVLTGQERSEAVTAAQEFGIDIQSRRAGGRAEATGIEKREGALVVRAIAAAESTATIRRALDLLDRVETGGVDAISLAVKQRLGIEGADEGELSGSLGKAVLSQLRETFGAAFTENEGKRLERIEAGFKKSPATNKRLLKQALRIAENTAKRGVKVASEGEAEDINDLLTFSLDLDDATPTTTNLTNLSNEQLMNF